MTGSEEKTGEPRQRDRGVSEAALLDAAIELFAQHGYHAATTRRIAERAGLNEQLITRYFGGKAGLLAAAYNRFIEEEANDRRYERLPLCASPGEEIAQFMLLKFEHYQRIERLLRIVFSRLLIDPAVATGMDNVLFGRGQALLTARLRQFQSRGLVRAGADIDGAGMAVTQQSVMIYLTMRSGIPADDDAIRKALARFAALVAAGLESNDAS